MATPPTVCILLPYLAVLVLHTGCALLPLLLLLQPCQLLLQARQLLIHLQAEGQGRQLAVSSWLRAVCVCNPTAVYCTKHPETWLLRLFKLAACCSAGSRWPLCADLLSYLLVLGLGPGVAHILLELPPELLPALPLQTYISHGTP